jgi:hypothetical protein
MKSNLTNFYELYPEYSRQQSFYGKALVEEKENGDEVLYSYMTVVAKCNRKKKTAEIYGGYAYDNLTNTTLRHIREFLKQNNMPIGSKKELIKMYCKD